MKSQPPLRVVFLTNQIVQSFFIIIDFSFGTAWAYPRAIFLTITQEKNRPRTVVIAP